MRNHEGNLIRTHFVLFQYIASGFVHGADGQFEDFLALHLDAMLARGN
jgi:hypothetical protein